MFEGNKVDRQNKDDRRNKDDRLVAQVEWTSEAYFLCYQVLTIF